MAALFRFSQDEPQGSDVFADHLKAIGVAQVPCPTDLFDPGNKAKRKVQEHRTLLGVVREEVEPVVGDVQGASDRSKFVGSKRADESDVLTTAADILTLQQWHLDGPLSFHARYFYGGF